MKFTDLFIRRPVLALVINLVIVIVGIQAIKEIESGIGKEAGGSHAETGEAIDSYHPTIV